MGFIPEANLRGVPEVIIWPPGSRTGIPDQVKYSTITLPRLIVWGIALLVGIICWRIYHRRSQRPIFKKKTFNIN